MLLGDLGADIIKLETPGEGDSARHQGAGLEGLSWYFVNCNRNKGSITVDLRSDEGRDILARLIAASGVLAVMGLTDERLIPGILSPNTRPVPSSDRPDSVGVADQEVPSFLASGDNCLVAIPLLSSGLAQSRLRMRAGMPPFYRCPVVQ